MLNEIFITLGRVGVIDILDLKKYFEIEICNIVEYIENKKYLKLKKIETKNEVISYIEMTELGELYFKEEFLNFKELYRGFEPLKSLTLSKFYLERTEDEKNTWRTKDDLVKEYQLQGTIDAIYLDNNKISGVKVINSTTKFAAIERAESFIKNVGVENVIYLTSV